MLLIITSTGHGLFKFY